MNDWQENMNTYKVTQICKLRKIEEKAQYIYRFWEPNVCYIRNRSFSEFQVFGVLPSPSQFNIVLVSRSYYSSAGDLILQTTMQSHILHIQPAYHVTTASIRQYFP